MYDKDFLESTILQLQDEVDDLERWSAHNKDAYNEHAGIIRKAVEELKKLEDIK